MKKIQAHGFHPESPLQNARIKAGLQQKEAAKLLGCTVRTIQGYEAGSISPRLPVIIKMKKVYNCEYEDLF